MLEHLEQPEVAQARAGRLREKVARLFTIDAMTDAMLALYGDLKAQVAPTVASTLARTAAAEFRASAQAPFAG
jgi:hypothetical protein